MAGPKAPKDPERKRPYFYIMKDKDIYGSVQEDGSIIHFIYESDGRLINSAQIAGNIENKEELGLLETVEGFGKLVHSIGVSVETDNPNEQIEFVFQMYGKKDLYGGGTNLKVKLTGDGMERKIYLSDYEWTPDDDIPGQIKFIFNTPDIMGKASVRLYLNDGYEAPADIEETEVDFTDHLNILTGETGAGKSILIGSIQSALGAKIPKDMIRHGCDSALIELIFHTKSQAVQKKMEEFEIPFEDGEIIISRRITNNRVINKVNDISVTIGRLKELSPLLLDLSGQHENQLLLKPQNHLKIIDSYHRSVIAPVKEKTASLYHEYQELQKKLSEQNMGEEQRIREMEFLKYEIQEIEEAQLRSGEDESLETEYQKVSHAKEILSDCAAVHEVTAGQNGCAGDLIGSAVQRLYTVSNLDAEARGLTEQLQTIDSLLNDFNRELSSYIDSMEFDGEQFAEIEERLNLINHLKAKYGDSIEKIQKYHDNSVEKYEKLSNYEEYISEIKRELSKVKEKLDIQCERLTALRKEAAIPLTKLIKEALLDLNFLDVVFEIAFEQSEHYSALGKDNVCFMISTNPGQAVRPLHEIASGGELSRIMLAIKSILADEENIETLIFDEIDTGISGRTAQKVSERLAYIAKKRQVIAITHLPQIAAMADSHYLIEKTSDANSTISNIYPLSEEESVKELARMLGGVKITEAVLQNAREMRALAKQ